jgi:hypothetical protein
MWKPWLQKSDPELPDFYTIMVDFIDGKSEPFQVVNHQIQDGWMWGFTHEDHHVAIPLSNVKMIRFGKDYTKTLEIRAKLERKNASIQKETGST